MSAERLVKLQRQAEDMRADGWTFVRECGRATSGSVIGGIWHRWDGEELQIRRVNRDGRFVEKAIARADIVGASIDLVAKTQRDLRAVLGA